MRENFHIFKICIGINFTRIEFSKFSQKDILPAAAFFHMRLEGVYKAKQGLDFRNSEIINFDVNEFLRKLRIDSSPVIFAGNNLLRNRPKLAKFAKINSP